MKRLLIAGFGDTVSEKGRILPARIVYVSTSGVYGVCAGAPAIYAKG
jgi:hypothetical protein